VTTPTPDNRATGRAGDRGFTLVEILTVVVILGIVALAVAFTVRGGASGAEAGTCGADARTLADAAGSYLASGQSDTIPAMGSSPNRFELALIDTGFLTQVSTQYDLRADGTVTTNGQPCP
jgi:prepilin-type N-terminal cleavage/methylation domain-containing protein